MNNKTEKVAPEGSSAFLDVRAVNVSYGATNILEGLSFQVKQGDIACLLGASGCGKTTLLRAIAGFNPVSSGEIFLNGLCVSSSQIAVAPESRNIGVVFQDFALFPHLSVTQNIEFGITKLSSAERCRRVAHLLGLVGLAEYGDVYPHQLSGGQQQRVALARALAPSPQLILLDEPFSSIDVELREALAFQTREILRQENVTAIMVSHDQNEAFALADSIAIMHDGSILQVGDYDTIYHHPAHRFVADFVGEGAFISAVVGENISTALGDITASNEPQSDSGVKWEALVRPHDLAIDDSSPVRATLIEKAFRGSYYRYRLELNNAERVYMLCSHEARHEVGCELGLSLVQTKLPVFSK